MSGFEVRINDREVTELNRVLRQAANRKELQRRLRKELRVEARKLIAPLRQSVMAIPSQNARTRLRIHSGLRVSQSGHQLRALIARAANVQVKTGAEARVRVFMDPRKMPDRMKSLPQYMEGSRGHEHWRHPVWGRWIEGQRDQPNHPYFERGTRDAERDAIAGVRRVMEQIAGEIER